MNSNDDPNKFQKFYFRIMQDLYYNDDQRYALYCYEMETFMVSNIKLIMSLYDISNCEYDIATIKEYNKNGTVTDDAIILYNILDKIMKHMMKLKDEIDYCSSAIKYYVMCNNDLMLHDRDILMYTCKYDCYKRLYLDIGNAWNDDMTEFYTNFVL